MDDTPASRALAAIDGMAMTAGDGPLAARAILALARAAVARAEAWGAYYRASRERSADDEHEAWVALDDALIAATDALIAALAGEVDDGAK